MLKEIIYSSSLITFFFLSSFLVPIWIEVIDTEAELFTMQWGMCLKNKHIILALI